MMNGRDIDVDDYETEYNLYMQQAVESGFLNDGMWNTSVEDQMPHKNEGLYCGKLPDSINILKFNLCLLEGMAAYSRLLLAPVEGWWPSATWRALLALLNFRCFGGHLPIIFIWVMLVGFHNILLLRLMILFLSLLNLDLIGLHSHTAGKYKKSTSLVF